MPDFVSPVTGGSFAADPSFPPVEGGSKLLFEEVAGAGGTSEFDTGAIDLSSYATVELRFRGRTDNANIYDEVRLQFNGDTDISHYQHAAQGSNPISTSSPGGFFSANWDSRIYFGGANVGAVGVAGILAGYATGAQAQADYTSGWRAILLDPGESHLPHSLEAYTRYIEAATVAHAAADNGPEIITLAGFWTPAAAAAVNRIRVYPGLGTSFDEGSKFVVRGQA